MRRLAVILTSLALSGVVTAMPAEAGAKPQIEDTRVVHAPIGKKGGLMNPVVWCSNGKEPKVYTMVTGLDNNFEDVFEYRGSLPGMFFPRVKVGRYQVTTDAKCGKRTASRTEVVKVKEKTHKRTISRAEFKRIKRGMTARKVNKIVGYRGFGSRYGRNMWRTYDMMKFWALATVEFRDGRVVGKSWDVGHD